MLTALTKIGHTDAQRISKEQKKQQEDKERERAAEDKRKQEKEKAEEAIAAQRKRDREAELARQQRVRDEWLRRQAAEGNKIIEVIPVEKECYFIKKDGTLWGMGENNSGQLCAAGRQDVPVLIAAHVKDAWATDTKCYFHKQDGSLYETGSRTPTKIKYVPDQFGFAVFNGDLIKTDSDDDAPRVIIKGIKGTEQYAAINKDAYFFFG